MIEQSHALFLGPLWLWTPIILYSLMLREMRAWFTRWDTDPRTSPVSSVGTRRAFLRDTWLHWFVNPRVPGRPECRNSRRNASQLLNDAGHARSDSYRNWLHGTTASSWCLMICQRIMPFTTKSKPTYTHRLPHRNTRLHFVWTIVTVTSVHACLARLAMHCGVWSKNYYLSAVQI